jgi:hypothetical protein
MKLIDRPWLVVLALTVFLVVISGCANKNTIGETVEPPRAPIKKIAILPIANPRNFTLEKTHSPLVFLGGIFGAIDYAERKSKNDGFSRKMSGYTVPLSNDLMQSLEQGLIADHYEVVVLRDQNMGDGDPSDFDYRVVKTDADAIIHVLVKQAGVGSPIRTTDYKPQLNVDIRLISAQDQSEIDDWSVDYGADAGKLDYGNIPADPRYAWGTYGILMEKLPEVVDGLQQGAKLMGKHIAKTMRERKR